MSFSEDALLQASATIVAAQIAAETFSVDFTDEAVVASALEAAMRAVDTAARSFKKTQADSFWCMG